MQYWQPNKGKMVELRLNLAKMVLFSPLMQEFIIKHEMVHAQKRHYIIDKSFSVLLPNMNTQHNDYFAQLSQLQEKQADFCALLTNKQLISEFKLPLLCNYYMASVDKLALPAWDNLIQAGDDIVGCNKNIALDGTIHYKIIIKKSDGSIRSRNLPNIPHSDKDHPPFLDRLAYICDLEQAWNTH